MPGVVFQPNGDVGAVILGNIKARDLHGELRVGGLQGAAAQQGGQGKGQLGFHCGLLSQCMLSSRIKSGISSPRVVRGQVNGRWLA